MSTVHSQLTVVGIDVGGQRKGFHAVALRNGAYLDARKTDKVGELVDWCKNTIAARVVAVDAPCHWSANDRARPAERDLMGKGIWCFSTPTRERAVGHPTNYYGWMLRGEELYRALQATYPLCNGLPVGSRQCCLETFPHAITWHLRGGNAKAALKRRQRRELLCKADIHLGDRAGIDTIDAALCAFTAHSVARGVECKSYGEPRTGLIIVPAGSL